MRQVIKGWAIISMPDYLIFPSIVATEEEVLADYQEWCEKYPSHIFSVRRVSILIEDEDEL